MNFNRSEVFYGLNYYLKLKKKNCGSRFTRQAVFILKQLFHPLPVVPFPLLPSTPLPHKHFSSHF
jgi:hypothetical protein